MKITYRVESVGAKDLDQVVCEWGPEQSMGRFELLSELTRTTIKTMGWACGCRRGMRERGR